MSDSDKNFVLTKRDLWVVGIAMSIIVALVGLGFGLVSGVPLAVTDYPTGDSILFPCLSNDREKIIRLYDSKLEQRVL